MNPYHEALLSGRELCRTVTSLGFKPIHIVKDIFAFYRETEAIREAIYIIYVGQKFTIARYLNEMLISVEKDIDSNNLSERFDALCKTIKEEAGIC